jgi:hypothetical protein
VERASESLAIDVCRAQAERFVDIEKLVAPKRTGKLAGSVRINGIGGGGAHASAIVSPHVIYASFRNEGGTISAKDGEVWKTVNGKSRMYRHTLHFDGTFALRVTQGGAHYVQKAEAAARGPCEEAAEIVLAWILDF